MTNDIGQVFGKWEIIGWEKPAGNCSRRLCRCACGTEKIVRKPSLVSGRSKSCGCLGARETPQIGGQVFGKWTVIREAAPDGPFDRWECRCVCGAVRTTRGHHLRGGRSTSCGCNRHKGAEAAYRHRLHDTRRGMMERCSYQNHASWKNYGGKGVQVCAAWLDDPWEFYRWAEANGWAEGLQIDRIDSDGNYCPENCRWVTPRVQAQNTSKSHNRELPIGVRKRKNKFYARISFGRKEVPLGSFETPEEASAEYEAAVQSCSTPEEAIEWRENRL